MSNPANLAINIAPTCQHCGAHVVSLRHHLKILHVKCLSCQEVFFGIKWKQHAKKTRHDGQNIDTGHRRKQDVCRLGCTAKSIEKWARHERRPHYRCETCNTVFLERVKSWHIELKHHVTQVLDPKASPVLDSEVGPRLDSEADLGLDSEEGPGLDAEEGPGLDAEAGLGLDSEEGPVLNAEAVSGLDAEAGPGLDSEAGLGLDSEEGPGSDMEAGPNSITSARISKLLKDGADAITIERLISAHGKLLIERLLKEMEECLAEIQADKQHPCQGSRWHELLQLFPSMFDHGEPLFAKIGTLNNPESLEYADVWLVTDDDACRRAQDGKPFPKPILICSDNNEMGSPLDDFLDRLMDRFGETTIDVQDLMVKNGGGPVRMDTPVVVERIKHPPPSLSNDAPPINCLNLRGGLVPTNKPRFLEGQRFDLIPTLHNRLDAGKRQTSTAGKQIDSIEIGRTNVDLHSCDSFGICATYGSWTGFHIDQHSGTYLTN